MLIKRIFIMKGERAARGVLKVTLLEGAYCEIELQTHYASCGQFNFVLKSGGFFHSEDFEGTSLKRKLKCFGTEGLFAGICDKKSGKVIMWAGDTPTIPLFLIEHALACRLPIIKENTEREKTKQPLAKSPEAKENAATEKKSAPIPVNELSKTKEQEKEITENAPKATDTEKEKKELKMSACAEKTTEIDISAEEKEVENKEASATASTQPNTAAPKEDLSQRFGITEIKSDTAEEEITEEEKEKAFNLSLMQEIESRYVTQAHDEVLEGLAPGSHWIKNEDGKEFSLGVLYNSQGATHVCYATKGTVSAPPSFDAEWLATENATVGYWVVYENL